MSDRAQEHADTLRGALAQLRGINGKATYLGTFPTELQAAMAWGGQHHCHVCGVRVLVSKGISWTGVHIRYVNGKGVARPFALCPDHWDRYKETL